MQRWTISRFLDSDLVAEFSISPSEDPIDLERRYGAILRQYDVISEIKPLDNAGFSAPTRKSHYIDEFKKRIMTTGDERSPMDNDHINRRKKGHSHAT